MLFRLIEPIRPTLCLDEMEGLEHEARSVINSILNSGYKAGGAVYRVEGDAFEPRRFDVYAPVALGGIEGAGRILQDRSITIWMRPGTKIPKVNREVNQADSVFGDLRADLSALALMSHREVRSGYTTLVAPDWLKARPLELFRPLLAVASLIDGDGDEDYRRQLEGTAKDLVARRKPVAPDGEALFDLLEELLRDANADFITVMPHEIAPLLSDRLGQAYSPTRTGKLLARYDFEPTGRKLGSTYAISGAMLAARAADYGVTIDGLPPIETPAVAPVA